MTMTPEEQKESNKLRARAWYAANKERAKIRNKAYRQAHVEEYKDRVKRYIETHKEELKAKSRERYLAHTEGLVCRRPPAPRLSPEEKRIRKLERTQRWRLANKNRIYEYNRMRHEKGLTWEQKNPEEMKEIKRRSAKKNHDKNIVHRKAWKDANRETIRAAGRAYMARKRKENPIEEKKKMKLWRQGNLPYKIRKALRGRINNAIRRGLMSPGSKCDKTMNLVGCTLPEFIKHIESQFQPGMTWENLGLTTWHLDHRKPLAAFPDLSDPTQQREAFHYSNIQPLWAKENMKKGANWSSSCSLRGECVDDIVLGNDDSTPLVDIKHKIEQNIFDDRSQTSSPSTPCECDLGDLK